MRQRLLQRVAQAADDRPDDVIPVLQVLVGEPVTAPDRLRPIAREVNRGRREVALASFREGALSTAEVVGRTGQSRQAIHQLANRGRLLRLVDAGDAWFPAWQFTATGRRPDLAELLVLLGRFTSDPVAADRVMRLARDELGGASIAERLDGRDAAVARALLARLGGAD